MDYKEYEIKTTQRGFAISDFIDEYNQECSIQKSSLADKDCIWLGVDKGLEGLDSPARMHLTQEMVESLLPLLNKFVETGELS